MPAPISDGVVEDLGDGMVQLEVMPGVYLVGTRAAVERRREVSYELGTFPPDICRQSELIEAEIRRLDTSLHHLVRSNTELREFDSNDPDCVQAIAENELTIQRQSRRRANLQAMLDKMEASAIEARTSALTGDTLTSASVPVITAASAVLVEVSSGTSTPPARTPEVEDDGVFL